MSVNYLSNYDVPCYSAMIFRKINNNYNIFLISKQLFQHGRKYSEKQPGNNNEESSPIVIKSDKKKRFKRCSTSIPTPCKTLYSAKLKLPYYKDLKAVKGKPVDDLNAWNSLKVKPNPIPAIRDNVDIDDNLKKIFEDLKKQRMNIIKKVEEDIKHDLKKRREYQEKTKDVLSENGVVVLRVD